jgi:hypothetical protein
MQEDDQNIILRKHRDVQRFSFQNISTQVNKFQPKQYIPMCKGFPRQAVPKIGQAWESILDRPF